jgi:hypothetical protein
MRAAYCRRTGRDGTPNPQSCMVAARPGMRIRRQRGAPRHSVSCHFY